MPPVTAQSPSNDTARDCLRGLLADFSFEITPKEGATLSRFPSDLHKDPKVYIPFLPKNRFADCLPSAERLISFGFAPVPHIAARRLRSETELTDVLAALQALGVTRTLVIAGDRSDPSGPFASAMDVLMTGALEENGIEHISVAGHPEGNPDISVERLADAIVWKNDYASKSSARLRLVTQFSFDPDQVTAWERAIRKAGNRLPISVGLAAPASLTTLMKYARMCGVRASGRQMAKRSGALMSLATEGAPDGVLEELAAAKAQDPDSLIDRIHFYTFGGSEKALDWIVNYRSSIAD